ncbi:cytochrome P450 2J4-like isoform X2 [Hemicordylus capensis]|uniref:cytochrome P450 2J4-like isoform X2 n=1 Tax=Hemicordylus capensis TaxID=884348 RepID=UPI00230300C5|nr:cytochrome P450 2J4-like isoform X2 [Hemicordylus capensis]
MAAAPPLETDGPGSIIFSNGHTWKQQRRFGLVTLRKLGLGKTGLEHRIKEEAQQLVETFAEAKGQPLDPSLPIKNSFSNVISVLTFGQRFSPEDEDFQNLLKSITFVLKFGGSVPHILYELLPWLMKHLPGPQKKVLSLLEEALSFAKKKIEKHKEHQALHDPQDFIDFYLLEMEKAKNDQNSTYNEENLAQCIIEFFVGGTDATGVTLLLALLLMATHPDIQEKVHQEMEDVFGSSSLIYYRDHKKLPYTNAVIHEIQRTRVLLLFGSPRQTTKDINMRGFHIPKGTIIIPDFFSALRDPEQWATPEEFNPNHFLDKDGLFMAREEFMAFGAGAHVCLAEHLARIELFIFFTSLLRAFTFQLPAGVKELNQESVREFTTHPKPYKLCAIPCCST